MSSLGGAGRGTIEKFFTKQSTVIDTVGHRVKPDSRSSQTWSYGILRDPDDQGGAPDERRGSGVQKWSGLTTPTQKAQGGGYGFSCRWVVGESGGPAQRVGARKRVHGY